jgi:hypothetical protein
VQAIIFLDKIPKAQKTAKIEKWNCIKLRSFCTAKETIKTDSTYRREKIFVNYSSNKELMPRIYKFSTNSTKQLNLKMS